MRKKTKTCPICAKSLRDKPEDHPYRPFCSKRCADIDLARWLDGRYAIPGALTGKDEDEDRDENDGEN